MHRVSLAGEKMAERGRNQRNVLQTLVDSDLIKCYKLNHTGIMVLVNLVRHVSASPTDGTTHYR